MSAGRDKGEPGVIGRGVLPREAEQPDKTQIPIDTKIRFIEATNENPLIYVGVTGSTPPSGYSAKTEYWSRRGPLKAGAITMETSGFLARSGSAEYAKELAEWLAGGSVLATAQEASSQQWIQGHYEPTAPVNMLYWAVDPDEPSSRRIGLLVECGSDSELLNVVWYKTTQPTDGLIFQMAPRRLSFTQVVVGEMKKPSTDPHDIDPQHTWYYYRGVMRAA